MKKAFGIMLSLLMIFTAQVTAFAAPPAVNSQTYVVMEVKSGQVLASRSPDAKMYPASITKILTCAIALENGSPEDKHTMTYKATHSIEPGSTHIALTEEEIVTVEDLLNATMIESANDAANGLAEYIAGDIDNFPELMNKKAEEVGAVNSHFMNAHGLHHKQHYTTAYDMALITRWALGIDGFRELFGATSYSVLPTNKQPIQRNIGTHHMMLVNSKFYYEGTEGGKLGWTPEARHTMVTLAERDGLELICVVMDTRTQYEKFRDSIALYDYCFENFTVSEIKVDDFSDTPIDVLDDTGEKVGEVTVPEQNFFVVHSPQLAKADIKPKLIAPKSYSEGDEIKPQIAFLDNEGNSLLTVSPEWEQEEIEPVIEVAAPVIEEPAVPEELHREKMSFNWQMLWAVPIICVAVYIILLLIRHHNIKLREMRRLERKREHEKKIERQMRESMIMVAPKSEPVMTISFPHENKQGEINPNPRTNKKRSNSRKKSNRKK